MREWLSGWGESTLESARAILCGEQLISYSRARPGAPVPTQVHSYKLAGRCLTKKCILVDICLGFEAHKIISW